MTDRDSDFEESRAAMVRAMEERGVRDARVLDALRRVPRHRFVPPLSVSRAYADGAQPIGGRQTISQPFVVALMTEALALTGDEHVLEIGAGSGYQTAVLSLVCGDVTAIERIPELARTAGLALASFGATNVRLFVGDGSRGWEADAPYDRILVAAAAPEVPPHLLAQLKPGGRLVLPVGAEHAAQRLLLLTKGADGSVTTRDLGEVSFVPLVGA